ncbi:hypothetical protein VCV18_001218 [Metarhizium anisopliae]
MGKEFGTNETQAPCSSRNAARHSLANRPERKSAQTRHRSVATTRVLPSGGWLSLAGWGDKAIEGRRPTSSAVPHAWE